MTSSSDGVRIILARDLTNNVLDRLSSARLAVTKIPNPGNGDREAELLRNAVARIDFAIELLGDYKELIS